MRGAECGERIEAGQSRSVFEVSVGRKKKGGRAEGRLRQACLPPEIGCPHQHPTTLKSAPLSLLKRHDCVESLQIQV